MNQHRFALPRVGIVLFNELKIGIKHDFGEIVRGDGYGPHTAIHRHTDFNIGDSSSDGRSSGISWAHQGAVVIDG